MRTTRREGIGSLMPMAGINPVYVPSIRAEFVRWADLSDDLDIVMRHGVESHGRITITAHDADGDGMDPPKTVAFLLSKGAAECVAGMLGALADVLPSSDDEFDRGSNPVTKQLILREAGDLLGLDPDQDGVSLEYQRGCVDLAVNVCDYEHEDVCAMLGLDYGTLYPGVRIIEDVPLPDEAEILTQEAVIDDEEHNWMRTFDREGSDVEMHDLGAQVEDDDEGEETLVDGHDEDPGDEESE